MIQYSREAYRKVASGNNLRVIAIGVQCYEDSFRKLPTGAQMNGEVGMHGWYTRCIPYMIASKGYGHIKFNLQWEHAVNRHFFGYDGLCLRPGVANIYTDDGYGLFHYQGNPNLLHRSRSVSKLELTAGSSNTWLLGEVDGQYQPWGYPFNWRPLVAPFNTGKGSFGGSRGGFQMSMADTSLRFINDSIDAETLNLLANAPPIASPELTQVPDRLFPAEKTSRINIEFFEAAGFPSTKGGTDVMIQFENGKPTTADLSEIRGRSDIYAEKDGRRIDLQAIANDYPAIKTLILGGPLDDANVNLILQFKQLETLFVTNIDLSEKNLESLRSLSTCRELVTMDNDLNLDPLRERLPNCKITSASTQH